MQDIVFYVSANETLGLVRDYANMHRADAPVLTIGVAVCLRMRLFADIEVSTPYPIASFSGITNWRWSMDADFDRSTACKLVADEDGISVHTVTDTVSGETRSFTEFVIPISNMNTQELAAWLGNESTRSGLTGELVGYDNNGNAIFVLQVENFTVRNRVAGLCDPTAVDEGIVTRSVAEQMIQTAVFSLAATKQDKLTASNGGTGISVTSTGIISVSNVPQSAVTGLSASLAGKQNALAFGWGLDHDYLDDVLSLARYRTVYSPTGATVTIVPGEAYKINAAASAKMIEAASIPDNTWGLEGHLEIFVAGTGYVQTGENVFLANALKPDAVNNCTVRFHDGIAIISVEDHIAGYIVMVNATSGSGSLNYALGVSTEYISVDASLNGQTLDLAGAVTNGEKHVVGNGYTETIVSGGINCTSKTTLSNLAADGVIVSSGTLTLGDVFIPSGSTVAVSGGGLAVEKVVGAGGTSVIDLGGTNIFVSYGSTVIASGCVLSNGSAHAGGALSTENGGGFVFADCTFSSNTASAYGGAVAVNGTASNRAFQRCTFVDNSNNVNTTYHPIPGYAMLIDGGANTTVSDCEFLTSQSVVVRNGANITLTGSNHTLSLIGRNNDTASAGTVTLTSGAILDLTGNTNATPIAPGGDITFASGGATVLTGATAGVVDAQYSMDNVTLPAGAKLTNTNVVDLGGSQLTEKNSILNGVAVTGGNGAPGGGVMCIKQSTVSANNCVFSGNKGLYNGGAFFVSGTTAVLYATSCVFSANSSTVNGGALSIQEGATVVLNKCAFDGNVASARRGRAILDNANLSLADCEFADGQGICVGTTTAIITMYGSNTIHDIYPASPTDSGSVIISSGASINLTSSINPGGTGGITVLTGGCTVNGNAIPAGTYTSIDSNGQPT